MIDKEHKPMKKVTKIILVIGAAILALVVVVGTVWAVLYNSGKTSLKASSSTVTPVVEVSKQDKEAIEKAKEKYAYGKTATEESSTQGLTDAQLQEVTDEYIVTEEEGTIEKSIENQTEQVEEQTDGWMTYNGKVYKYNEDTMNFVLMGIDRHGNLSSQEDFSDDGPGQADAIFLVSLNTRDKKLSIIGIPRNSMVEIEVYNSQKQRTGTIYNQICLQYPYAGGGSLGLTKMKESVSDLFYQLPIHGACAINFDAIGVIVDKLGGIEVTIPEDLTKLNPSYVKGSKLTLTKDNAWMYLKYRDTSVLGSPTSRLTRQKEFMKTAVNVAIGKVKRNPTIVSDIYKSIASYMNTDIALDEAVYLATEASGYKVSNDSFYQLTGYDKKVDYVNKSGNNDFFDDYYLDESSLKDIFIKVFYTEVDVDSD
jgi:LCP family protein required for cell wall assembly